MITRDELVEIGIFNKPHGVEGEISATFDCDAETAAVVLPLLSKEEVAAKIADRMAEKFNAIRTE